ncbi:N-acetyl-gamma-glutamyl-phosphate reductase [Helicobacter apodemus]|uniref:N-acetyl-gamma-glutamyl-phosphate reductase n=1 Tax=Helicobacter apodemus TaxID=135569 RepID=A0A2U8FCT9_9HELI|nr:N-acetyl-gamma-glutamyl-phosphate reductase [Helicobacter apodemus]AWI33657.1 N-acetyl-gamma-glutamyl-phosphate reductase [Helicobacter apodemus]
MKIAASIIGAGGYTGLELIKLLINHPIFELVSIYGTEYHEELSTLYPSFKKILSMPVLQTNIQSIVQSSKVVFLALPHQKAMEYIKILSKHEIKIIDLSADYRLSLNQYEAFYTRHLDAENLNNAIYGLPEYNRSLIAKSNLIANPGCYPTASLLAILPFIPYLDSTQTLYIDAKSGVSGAGKKLAYTSHFVNINENLFAYSPITHRHSPEIDEQITKITKTSIKILFVPHLIPLTRGMLVSIYARLKDIINPLEILQQHYKEEKFIRICDYCVQIKNVVGTHFCDIYAKNDGKDLFITASIDNLLRGASSQAVANANLMCGLEETLGLPKIAYVP